GPEVDNIVSEAYGELRDASQNGLNMQTAGQVYQTLMKHLQRLLELGKDAAEDVLENHPQLKDKLGGSADQLKQLGEQIGPKAKKVCPEILLVTFHSDAVIMATMSRLKYQPEPVTKSLDTWLLRDISASRRTPEPCLLTCAISCIGDRRYLEPGQ